MTEAKGTVQGNVEALLESLRGLLHAEMSISQPSLMTFDRDSRVQPLEQEGVELKVRVRNDAASNNEGGEVVFIGVGLRIVDGQEQHTNRSSRIPSIGKTRPSDRPDIRQGYTKGAWIGGRERFPAATSSEESFGEILFPGESVVYEMHIPTVRLPYISIQVEGSVSRRHLLRFVQTMVGLEQWTKPMLVEAFRTLIAADISGPIRTATSALPEFGPQTTLNEISALRQAVEKAMEQITPTSQALNNVFRSAPNDDLRNHLKDVVSPYLRSVRQGCSETLDALSSGDVERMRSVTESLRGYLADAEEVSRETLKLMSRLGIARGEVDTEHKPG